MPQIVDRIGAHYVTSLTPTDGDTLVYDGDFTLPDGTSGAWTTSTSAGVSVTTPDDQAHGYGTGTVTTLVYDTVDANANHLKVNFSAGGGTDVPVVSIGIGINDADMGVHNGVTIPRVALHATGALTTGSEIVYYKSRGTHASPTAVTSGDDIGSLRYFGAVAAGEYVEAAQIRVDLTGTVATTRAPGNISLNVATDAAPSVMTERILIEASLQIVLTPGTDVVIANGTGLIVGATAQVVISDGDGATNLTPEVQVLGTTKADGSILIGVFSATATSAAAPALNFLKSANATIGSNTIVASGEVLGEVNFFGADGSDFESCAVSIRGLANAGPGVGDMPGRLSVFTSTDGAETPTERMRITGTATASTTALGIAGATTGILTLAGATSGVITITPNATAGTWTLELPAAVGGAGQQLTDAGGNGVTSWAAASLGEWKNDLGILDPELALKAMLAAPTHKFTYNADVLPLGQSDGNGFEFTGIFAEEAPWAMYGQRDGYKSGIAFSPTNAFGYTRAAIEALSMKIRDLEEKLALVA